MFNRPTKISIVITFLICYLIYYIVFNTNTDLNLNNSFQNIEGPIENISDEQAYIRDRLTYKINNLKIVELEKDDNIETITHFNISQNDIPIGSIRYFLYKLENNLDSHPSNHNCWLKCDGSSVKEEKFPELFKIITGLTREPEKRSTFKLPNLIGRFINTSGEISTISTDPPFMDYSNTSVNNNIGQNRYGIMSWENKAIRRPLQNMVTEIKNNDTSGYDHCNWKNEVAIKLSTGIVPWYYKLCSSNQKKNNMPPFIL